MNKINKFFIPAFALAVLVSGAIVLTNLREGDARRVDAMIEEAGFNLLTALISARSLLQDEQGSPKYGKMSNAFLVQTHSVPRSMVANANHVIGPGESVKLQSAWGGSVDFVSVADTGGFVVSYEDVPAAVCLGLVDGLNFFFRQIKVNGVIFLDPLSITYDEAAAACNSNNSKSVQVNFIGDLADTQFAHPTRDITPGKPPAPSQQ